MPLYVDAQALEDLQQTAALGLRHRMNLLRRRDAGTLHQHRHHQAGYQALQNIVKVPVGVLLKVPQQTAVQLLLIQCGLQIQIDVVVLCVKVPHMGAGAENQRPGQTKVGEQ